MAPSTTAKPNIGHATARGFVWLIAQGVGEKVLTLASQVALARLLTENDYKLIALTYTITTFASILQQGGISQVLINRHRRFHLWATTAFWMSLAIGLAAGAATAALAPVASAFYQQPALKGLLLAAAITLPLNALITVPDAKLRANMQFRFVAALGLAAVVGTLALSILFAALGFGPYSFILPPVIVTLIRAAVMWWWSYPHIHMKLHLRRWKYLFGDSAMLLIGTLALMVTYQGGQIILGRIYPALTAAGVFYFAWNLSDQSLRLLVNNLAGALFPALSTMRNDPARQRAAFLRSTRILMLIGVPLCLLQAVTAGPLIRIVFSTKWEEAAPVMAALCIGMTSRLVTGSSDTFMIAQGRYTTFARLSIFYAITYTIAVTAAALLAGPGHAATGAALGAAACLLLLGPVSLRCALGPGSAPELARVYTIPAIAGALAFAPGLLIAHAFPSNLFGDLAAIAATTAVCSTLYASAMWLFAREELRDVHQRILAVLRRAPSPSPDTLPASTAS
jgi:lipopolysaccharide exporter